MILQNHTQRTWYDSGKTEKLIPNLYSNEVLHEKNSKLYLKYSMELQKYTETFKDCYGSSNKLLEMHVRRLVNLKKKFF